MLYPKLLLACGKEGTIYVINRENMAKARLLNAARIPMKYATTPYPPLVDRQVRAIGGHPTMLVDRDALFGGPAYFEDSTGTHRCFIAAFTRSILLYLLTEPDHLKAFRMDPATGKLTSPQPGSPNESVDLFGGEGGSIPVVSSNGSSDGIIWQIDRQSFDSVAFEATNLANRIIRLSTTAHPVSPFLVPAVMNGKVIRRFEYKIVCVWPWLTRSGLRLVCLDFCRSTRLIKRWMKLFPTRKS
jgi:hypothetical protein